MTKEDALEELARLAAQYPAQKLTRDFVVKHSSISTRLVTKHFGDFMSMLKCLGLESRARRNPDRYAFERPEVPLSEKPEKQVEEATAQDVIDDVRRVALLHPNSVITRNFYRQNGHYSDSVWSQYFGTWAEVSRQAGLALTRNQHGMERHIAKHVSADHYRKFNVDRCQSDWHKSYEKPIGQRWITDVIIFDCHDINIDPFVHNVFLDTLARIQPHRVIFGGDLFDLPEFGKYNIDPRHWDVAGRIEFVHKNILKPSRDAAPNALFELIEGNHEYRLIRHLADASPALKVVLSDLHGMSLRDLFGLDKYEVNYVSQADLSAFRVSDVKKELQKNYRIYDHSYLIHHTPEGRLYGFPGACGHHHKWKMWDFFSVDRGPYTFIQSGCAHVRNAEYCDADKWSQGFVIAHTDVKTHNTILEYIDIKKDFAVVGGKFYFQTESPDS